MAIRKFLGAILFLLAVLPAAAQNMVVSRTTGIVEQALSLPGYAEMPAGAPYQLEITSYFSPGVQESTWAIGDFAAYNVVVLIVGGNEFHFDGTGPAHVRYMQSSDGRGNLTNALGHSVSWAGPPGGPDALWFANGVQAPAAIFPLGTVDGLYESGGLSYPSPPVGTMLVEFTGLTDQQFQRSSFNPHPATFELILGPIPEPGMGAMMLAGFGAFAAIGFLKKRSA